MECHNHPDREAVANCSVCGKAICQDCSMEIAGNIYCKDCVNEIVTKSILEKAVKEANAAPAAAEETKAVPEPVVPETAEEPAELIEPVETITPIQQEEIAKPVEKAPENFQTDYEYETEYVETYEDDGTEDSYYENPAEIPEPEPEYKEQQKLREEAEAKKAPIKPVHAEAPSNEVEAKYEKYLEDLYYDEEEAPQGYIEEDPRARPPRDMRRRRPRRDEYDDYYEGPRRQRPRYPDEEGEIYINPREDEYEDDFIVPSHNRRRDSRRDSESYEDLKRRIERNYEREQEAKKRGRFRRSKKQYDYDDELENIQEMHRFPVEEESEGFSITEIVLAVVLIILILFLILYVVYLFRLSGDYSTFFEALTGLIQNPSEFITKVMNFI